MKNKKGVELTMNTMIIAILALIVLVVMIMIFTNGIQDGMGNIFNFNSCKSRGNGRGYCMDDTSTCDGTKLFKIGGCKGELPYCCIPKES